MNGTSTFAATCMEYFSLGNRRNGTYKIRPSLEHHSFEVQCEFTSDEGLTVLKPTTWRKDGFTYPPTEEKRCFESECFEHSFEYKPSLQQIEVQMLINLYSRTNF